MHRAHGELSPQMQVQDLAEMESTSLPPPALFGQQVPQGLHTPAHKHMIETPEVQMEYAHKKSWPVGTQPTAPSTQALKASAVLSPPGRAPGGWVLIPVTACVSLERVLEE